MSPGTPACHMQQALVWNNGPFNKSQIQEMGSGTIGHITTHCQTAH